LRINFSTYFSIWSFSIRVPPSTAIIIPTTTYTNATLGPNILIRRTKEPRSTIGEDIRKEKVTPKGSPADVNPIKRGIEEHEQKGVTVPSKAAIIFAPNP